ncbi:MAG: hypothetical protein WBP81_10750, partial [Solirubrobacteraceae bacterium]
MGRAANCDPKLSHVVWGSFAIYYEKGAQPDHSRIAMIQKPPDNVSGFSQMFRSSRRSDLRSLADGELMALVCDGEARAF